MKNTSSDIAALAAQMGANVANSSSSNATRLPQLVINSQVDDDQGNPLPRGSFTIRGTEIAAYADKVTFRPLSNHFQYLDWDNVQKRLANKSKIIASFKEEAIDMTGTLRCGKPVSSELREMPPEKREKYASITCFRQVRGLVSGEAKTAAGETVIWENEPVILMLKGTNFSPFEDEYIKAIPSTRSLWDFACELTSKRHKNGSVTWFTFHFAPNLKTPLGLDEKVVETIQTIADSIKSENNRIKKAYDAAVAGQTLDRQALDAIQSSLDDDLEDEVDDAA